MEKRDYEVAADELAAKIESLGLAVACEFVPFSQSRNAKGAQPSLNWRCAVTRNGRPVKGLESVDYMKGAGHCPAYKASVRDAGGSNSMLRAEAIARECETGKVCKFAPTGIAMMQGGPAIGAPTAAEIIGSLASESDVLDYATFEDWAPELGLDPDSRAGEAIYRLCMSQALALRAAIGDAALSELRDIAGRL